MNRRGRHSILLATLAMGVAFGQDVTGLWQGTLASKRVILNISRNKKGELGGMMYSADPGATAYPFTSIALEDANLTFSLNWNLLGVRTFAGKIAPDGNSIDGTYHSQTLLLKRVRPEAAPETKKSEPVSPATRAATEAAAKLLDDAREKLTGMTRRLTKYTCLESVDRTYFIRPPQKASRNVMTEQPASCAGIHAGHTGDQVREAADRLRLQVGVAGGTEIHSWPNSAAFDTRSLFQMVPTGPLSTGAFGLYLVDVFENPGTQFYFIGRSEIAGGEVFVYHFRVPLAVSHLEIRGGDQWITTAYAGSFELYTATAELANVKFETDELPPVTGTCRSATNIEYHMVLIGDGELLLPIRSELDDVAANGYEGRSVTTFSACSEYRAESNIRFDDATSPDGASSKPSTSPVVLPPGLPVTLALIEPIGHGAAAGDRVEAKVTKELRDPATHRVLVPSGAIASGRITLMRRRFVPSPVFEVSMSFDKLDVNGTISPLSLRVDRSKEKPRGENGLRARRQEFSLPSAEDGEVTLIMSAVGAIYAVPPRWETKWITR